MTEADLTKTREQVRALRELAVRAGYELGVKMLDGLLADLDGTERVLRKWGRNAWLLQVAQNDPEEARYIESDIRAIMETDDLTWDEAAALVQADSERYEVRRKKEEEQDTRVELFVRTLDHEMTLKQIKDATEHRNMFTIGRICKRLVRENLIQPLPRYCGADTLIIPRSREAHADCEGRDCEGRDGETAQQ